MSSGVEFDEGGYGGPLGSRQYGAQSPKSTPIYSALIRWGVVKDEAGARLVSVWASVFLIVVAVIIMYLFVLGDGSVAPPDERFKIGDSVL